MHRKLVPDLRRKRLIGFAGALVLVGLERANYVNGTPSKTKVGPKRSSFKHSKSRSRLIVSRAKRSELDALAELLRKVYALVLGCSLRTQLNSF